MPQTNASSVWATEPRNLANVSCRCAEAGLFRNAAEAADAGARLEGDHVQVRPEIKDTRPKLYQECPE
eukprot:1881176-Rhodomonas_salina.3